MLTLMCKNPTCVKKKFPLKIFLKRSNLFANFAHTLRGGGSSFKKNFEVKFFLDMHWLFFSSDAKMRSVNNFVMKGMSVEDFSVEL